MLAVLTEPAVMDQIGMSFSPRLLVARPGQLVQFRNSDDVPHGVRVRSTNGQSALFSVSVDTGQPFEHRFDRPGGYDVTCDIHPGMSGFILVDAAPYAAVADPSGAFSFTDVPTGSYTLSVWSIDPTLRLEHKVEITAGRTELTLGSAP
jgi:plastocyanin